MSEQAFVELIRWRDSCIDAAGDQLMSRILSTLQDLRVDVVPPQHHPALLEWRKLPYGERASLVYKVLKSDDHHDDLGHFEKRQILDTPSMGRYVRMHRETYENVQAVISAARSYHEVNDDRHECPRDGAECDGCRLKDALKKLPPPMQKEPT